MKSHRVETAIERLYKLGSKGEPPRYESSPEAETLMNLYLLQKHGFKNPMYDKIIHKYRHYRLRRSPIETHADHLEHCVYINRRFNLVSDNNREYAELFLNNLLEMIQLNPGKKLVCDFKSCLFVDDEFDLGHSEMVIFDPAFNTFEYVDSNHVPIQFSRKTAKQFAWQEARNQTMQRVAAALPSKPIYITNADIYTNYDWGLQSLESGSERSTKEEETGGYCLMWSHLLGDLSLAFPHYSVAGITKAIFKKANSSPDLTETLNDYMLAVIRGYVKDVSNVYSVDFSSTASKHDACYHIVARL
jgi:hypothetical protein